MNKEFVRSHFLQILSDRKYDWKVRSRENCDDVGVFRVEYVEGAVGIYIEKSCLGIRDVRHGEDVFNFFNEARDKLAGEAWILWQERLDRFVFRRRVTWPELLKHVGPHKRAQLIFALASCKTKFYGSFSLLILPPALSQQSGAVNLPRFDKPGYPDRVYSFHFMR